MDVRLFARSLPPRLLRLALVLLLPAGLAAAETLTVSDVNRQKVEGWGVFAFGHTGVWGTDGGTFPFEFDNRPAVLDAVFRDMGVTHLRVQISALGHDSRKPGWLATYDHDGNAATAEVPRLKEIADLIKAARTRNPNLKWYVSVWSPPGSMKTPENLFNNIFSHVYDPARGGMVSTGIRPASNRTFAQWIVKALQYLEGQGAGKPVAVSPFNEPRHLVGYEGVGVIDAQQVKTIVNFFRSEFNAAGFSATRVIAPEGNHYDATTSLTGDWSSGYLWLFNNDSAGQPNIHTSAIVGTHSYDSWASDQTLQKMFDRYRGAQNSTRSRSQWMTEWSADANDQYSDFDPNRPLSELTGRPEMDVAITTARHLLREMMQFNFNLWTQWNVFDRQSNAWSGDEVLYGFVRQNSNDAPKKSKIYHVLSSIWSRVPAGSHVRTVRNDAGTGSFFNTEARPVGNGERGVDVGAFRRPDGRVVMVVVNDETRGRSVNLAGLNAGPADVYVTDGGRNNVKAGSITVDAVGRANHWFGARSVTVIHCLGGGGGARPNLVANAGFESGQLHPWRGYGSGTRLQDWGTHTGRRAARLGNSSTNGIWTVVNGLVPGTTYRMTAWIRGNAVMKATGWGGVEQLSNSGTRYNQKSLTFTTGPGVTSARLDFWSGGGDVRIDDVELRRE
ncbi:carbohydrate binding domain-containing protein [Phycisphaera mikurensis]|uniref:CBM-cenC domain-containing protein n=1 Tax=Phycisphaera mikurensis (strain NBRC 102666 / KCTC 22515 / FYK2301M01) TaxID=1142394 RepID=I0IC58_PHYMF|nr:carbohydrate binding domain-containing protein [Phycisphaera mikurensis]MBB6441935.1 O-glycosyl hydrolase [Phycisphaera mikurensis]BAM02846.1 hypothetical protein PSMK_06870 [Phycisphaera mikurensis NBRC 102666]